MDHLTRLALAARDDATQLEEFLVAAQVDVWRLCRALVDADHVDDVAQDSLMRVMKALPSFRSESSARTWALRITRYTCADWVRDRQRQRRLVGELADLAPRQHLGPADGRVEIEILLDALPDDYRAAFALTQLIGLSYADAAEVSGCEIGTIRSRVSRARERLVEALAPRSVEDHG